ncbi:HlyD family type I secretion periplasmic adaptor subunit [Pectobacterium parmentieri]|uniref:HlyD family type I secretion periplasmic adaptor subunit n=1 Tax=Pectobacterium parmentieri TaxID=1905730 RepID=UPI000CDDB304|nr:HlyD family type I secretion periplasmic adaptor subunit [Pectobacterium parmentieri]AYH06335.1 HlyD family type I secretion periplasmic adaptor subunit [Pectobacterium parmentieri]AYH15154.1 HlyD family type I secretion periplasmic adaptor subunit [Pectobacterium parmentieri]AYH23854.1 HlyD family type I secretion periplasmic adaptor subunit [Pectobacterium parmentieri]MBN3176924.1 HlyD family type I secretion periplasmic adaptor subunit [Pectobacterium parmentieri]POW30626.1 HlyD family t
MSAFELSEENMNQTARRDEKRAVRLGWLLVLAGFGSFLLWALFAPLDKGVMVNGSVVISGNRKVVQHNQGGIVDKIQVKDGDSVEAGQILLTLNEVDARSASEGLDGQYLQLVAREGRLLAEQQRLNDMVMTPRLQPIAERPEVSVITALQRDLLRSRQQSLKLEAEGMRTSIAGMEASLSAQRQVMFSKQKQRGTLEQQLEGLRSLAAENYVPRNKMLENERLLAQLNGDIAQLAGDINRTRHDIEQQTLLIAQRQQEYDKEVNSELAEVQALLSDVGSKKEKADFNLANIQIRAPVSGTVVGLKVFTEGGVIAPGQTLLEIVPGDQPLRVDAHLPVELVDKVWPGLPVELQFVAFNQSTTPRVAGTVELLSADRLLDERDGSPYYSLRVMVDDEGKRALEGLEIKPGMPVQGFVRTGERSFVNYLFKPLMDRLHLALTEE